MALTDSDRDLLLQTFLTEAGEHLRTLEESLVALEARPDDAELLNGIFRVAHSLKGDALMVGFPRIAEFAHGLEDLLERLRDGALAVDADVTSLLLRAVDVLRALLADRTPFRPTSKPRKSRSSRRAPAPTPNPRPRPSRPRQRKSP